MRLSLRMASSKNSPVLQRAELRLSIRLLQHDSRLHRMQGPSSKAYWLKQCKGPEGDHNMRGASCSRVGLKQLR